MNEIPSFVVEYFLLGRTRRDAIERYTQDGGIVSDVWLQFAKDRSKPQLVLIAPTAETSAVALGYALHQGITAYRAAYANGQRERSSVSPLENFVSAKLYFDELLRVVLPLTAWWHRKHLGALRRKAVASGIALEEKLERAIRSKLGKEDGEIAIRESLKEESVFDRRVIEAAPLAALIGVFMIAEAPYDAFADLRNLIPGSPGFEEHFEDWIMRHAEEIAQASRFELSRQLDTWLMTLQHNLSNPMQSRQPVEPEETPELIQRVFLNRKASLADTDANCTVKADAAMRVFNVSCRNITWAMIDSGIATSHPAFLDHDARDRQGRTIVPTPTRIRATLDFTKIDLIRNFDLIAFPADSPMRREVVEMVVNELVALPGTPMDANFRETAASNLLLIASQLERQLPPDWNLIEPLILRSGQDTGDRLVSDHGTHVAGILGADWRRTKPDGQVESLLQGVCPDIKLYDLRVIHQTSRQSTEFAVLAALEYVQFVNDRAGSNGPVIHGVNVSMSIPHDVRNYGCGTTPVCVACDRLVSAGVVVVAAAGNRGWNEMEIGFGNFVFCSITDPGNAHNVITVGATHRVKPHIYGISYFSSRGPTGDGRLKPDLVAPGEQIRGPIRGDADDELDGTSMAAPIVSGAAAILIARHRELIGNPLRVKEVLCKSATDLGREKYFQGNGLVDVLRALQSI